MKTGLQMVDLIGQYHEIKDEVDQRILQVIGEAKFINGPEVTEFAGNLASYLGVKHVIPCANGTDALQLALMAFDFPRGSEIIVPSFTYVATVEVIALLGFKPVFVEVNRDSFNMNIEDLEGKITSNAVAIVPVHLYGQCSNMEGIMNIAKDKDLVVIEDTAQAIGAKYTFSNGTIKSAGVIGDIGTTSFFPSKNLGCYGDGGAVFTNDDRLASTTKMMANHGQAKKYQHDSIGVNSRLDTIQAAILNVKLKRLNEYILTRQKVAECYDKGLQSDHRLEIPARSPFSSHVFHQYTIKLHEDIPRDLIQRELADHGVPSMVYYPIPTHMQKAYVGFGYKKGDLEASESLSKCVLSLPIHTQLDRQDQNFIIDTLLASLGKF